VRAASDRTVANAFPLGSITPTITLPACSTALHGSLRASATNCPPIRDTPPRDAEQLAAAHDILADFVMLEFDNALLPEIRYDGVTPHPALIFQKAACRDS
jgi:hypothetical protein